MSWLFWPTRIIFGSGNRKDEGAPFALLATFTLRAWTVE
jgi:hypothetical protein